MWIHPLRYLTLLKYYILDANSPATVRYLTLLKYYILDANSSATLPHTTKIVHPWCEYRQIDTIYIIVLD